MRRRFFTLDVFTSAALRRQSARGRARRRRARHRRDAGDRARVQPVGDGVRVSAERSEASRARCASSRRRASCRSPAIRRSAPRCCWRISTAAAAPREIVLEEEVGPVRLPGAAGGGGGHATLRHSEAAGAARARFATSAKLAAALGLTPADLGFDELRAGELVGRQSLHLRAGARPRRDRPRRPDMARWGEAFGRGDPPGAFLFCRRGGRCRRTPSTPACSRRPWASSRIRRPARRSRPSPAVLAASGLGDGAARLRHRAGLRDGPAEPAAPVADHSRRQAREPPRSAATPSWSAKARSRLDRAWRALRPRRPIRYIRPHRTTQG